MLRIGHRGACGYEPENTLRSFNRALQLRVDMVELDVHVCRSGEIVVIHDSKVDRTTGGTGYVADKTLDELRTLDAGKGEKIPTLQEVLTLVNRKVKVNIELKGTGTAKPVFQLLEKHVRELGWSYGDFLISSFKPIPITNGFRITPFFCSAHETAQGSPSHSSMPSVISMMILRQLSQEGKSPAAFSRV